MEKSLGLLVVAVVALAAGIGIGYYGHGPASAGLGISSRDAAAAAVQAITAHWDPQELTRRQSVELVRTTTPDQVAGMFNTLRPLGDLTGIQGCQGSARAVPTADGSEAVSADYTCAARYQAGAAQVEINLVKTDSAWQVSGFRVSSPQIAARR